MTLTTNLQTVPYLPRQRNFPSDKPEELSRVIDKAYIEIAQRVNERTIGLYAVNFAIITGNQWYLSGQPQKQQTLRKTFAFTSIASIPHGIIFSQIDRFVDMYGDFTDGTNWYGLIAGSNIAIAGQVSFYLTPTNIVFLNGAGSPVLTKGNIVLEWLSMF